MERRGDLKSTGYALANPGQDYLVPQPGDPAERFTVTLETGTYGPRGSASTVARRCARTM